MKLANQLFSVSFTWMIAFCGLVLALSIAGNLTVLGLKRHPFPTRLSVSGGEPEKGRAAIRRYGCGGCHVIPGIREATGSTGPRLDAVGMQNYIAGVLPNTPENMVLWIKIPERISPGTAMPNLSVSHKDARDIAAYLYENGH